MTGKYLITVQVWPYSGISNGKGAKGDQELVGDQHRSFEIDAQDFADAYKQARLIVQGIRSHGAVWEVPITGIIHESESKRRGK
jgi:hypothetical protein